MKQRYFAFLLVLAAFFLAVAVSAQDDPTPEPAPTQEWVTNTPTPAPTVVELPVVEPTEDTPAEEPTVEPFLKGLLDYINQATSIAEIAVLALILTQLLKYWVFDRFLKNPDGTPQVSAAMLHIGVQVALWGGHLVAVHFGYGTQYIEWGQRLGEFLMGIRGILIPATASVIMADQAYKRLHKARVSGFSYRPRKAA